MDFLHFKSIRIRLIFLVSLIFIPLYAIIFYSSIEQKEKAHNVAKNNALWNAQNLANQQQFVESNIKQLLTVLSQLPEIEKLDTLRLNHIFSSILQQNPYYASILMVDAKGCLIASGVPPKTTLNVSDRKYFKSALATKEFTVGEFAKGRLSRKQVVHFALPVINKNNEVYAVLITSFDVKYYDKFIKSDDFSDQVIFTFTDQNGIILHHSSNVSQINGIRERADILNNLVNKGRNGTFAALGGDGIRRLYGFECLEGVDKKPYMYIYVGIPEKIAYAGYHKTLVRNSAIMILAALLVVFSAYFFSKKYLIDPISRVLKSATLISEGNLDTKTDLIYSSTEMGRLSAAMDQMTAKLRQRDQETKQVEKDLRKLKERFELAINSANIGIWDWHIRNNSLIWDKNMFELYGISAVDFDFNMENWRKLVHPEDLENFDELIHDSILLHRPFHSEMRIQNENGTKYVKIYANIILNKENEPVRLIGVNWNITEQKMLEKELYEAKEKVETGYRLKSEYFANISHEIRTPLHGIIGFTQILKSEETTRQELLQYLDIIESSGNNLMQTITKIIDYQLLDANQLKLINVDCKVSEIADSVYNKVKAPMNGSPENLFLDQSNDDALVNVDKNRVSQILLSVIDHINGLNKHSSVRLGWKLEGCMLVFYVSLFFAKPEDAENYQVLRTDRDLVASRQNNLSDLNLLLCKSLAEYMGGKIWVENNPDHIRLNTSFLVGVKNESVVS